MREEATLEGRGHVEAGGGRGQVEWWQVWVVASLSNRGSWRGERIFTCKRAVLHSSSSFCGKELE